MKIKQKIIIFVLIITGVTSLVIIGIIIPTVREIKNISTSIYNERIDLEKKYQRGQLLKQTVNDFEKIKPAKSKLTDIFFETNQELFIVTTLENIAANNSLTQKIQIQPQSTPKTETHYSTLLLKITASGDFASTMKYLSAIEALPYMINIKTIAINKNAENLIQSTIEAEVYMTKK
jgi:Tfp pilus assembly protein PilO